MISTNLASISTCFGPDTLACSTSASTNSRLSWVLRTISRLLCGRTDDSITVAGLSFYEEIGRSNFRAASDHRLARRYELDAIFNTLAERFQETRRALNELRDCLLSLGDPEPPSDVLLKPSPSK